MGNVAVVHCPQCGLGNTMYLGNTGRCGRCGVPLDAPDPEGRVAAGDGEKTVPSRTGVLAPLVGSTFRPLERLARFAAMGFAVVVFVEALFATVLWQRADLLGAVDAGELVSHADAVGNDRLLTGVLILWGLLFLVATVLFMWWFKRAYGNLSALGVPQKYGVGWAIGAWFVPFLNLYRPWKIAEEIWRGSAPDGQGGHESDDIPRQVRAWFFLGLAAWAILRISEQSDSSAALRWVVASQVLTIVSGLFGIWMIKRVTERQEARRRVIEPSAPLPA